MTPSVYIFDGDYRLAWLRAEDIKASEVDVNDLLGADFRKAWHERYLIRSVPAYEAAILYGRSSTWWEHDDEPPFEGTRLVHCSPAGSGVMMIVQHFDTRTVSNVSAALRFHDLRDCPVADFFRSLG